MNRLALFVAVLVIAGCGAQDAAVDPASDDAWMDGIPGTYATDARRTHGTVTLDKDGNEIQMSEEDLDKLQESQGLGSMRLVLKDDNSFELIMGVGEGTLRTGGTWQETSKGLSMVTKTVGGEPAPPEAQMVEHYTTERGYIVADLPGGKKYYLKKQKPE